ncbi:MAG: cadmium resistance transporter [Limnochordia bacterium]|nr:cadmium resistance transporter [Limnochordia bacterium]MDD4517928.1 cadmium resistance transporter [Limnochordia bacterium]
MIQDLITAIVAFVATNIDEMLVLTALFSQTNGSTFKTVNVVLGQYLGFAVLTCLSILASFGILVVPTPWIGLLGLVPLYEGIKMLGRLFRPSSQDEPSSGLDNVINSKKGRLASALSHSATYQVAAIAIGNGSDNVAVYIPLFTGSNGATIVLITITFSVLVALWCLISYRLVQNRVGAALFAKYGDWITPLVLIGLGTFILISHGTVAILLHNVRP